MDKKRRFDSIDAAQHWLVQYCTATVISNSDLDIANSNYAWCGIIWGDETHRPIEATIVRTQDVPIDDIRSGKAKIFGAGGLKELWKSNVEKKHLPGMHDQQTHATHEVSKQRQEIEKVHNVNSSLYKYGRQASIAIKSGEKVFMSASAAALQNLGSNSYWKSDLSEEAKKLVADSSYKDAITELTDKGMTDDSDKLRKTLLNETINHLNSFGDGKSKIGSGSIDGIHAASAAVDWLKTSVRTNVRPAVVSLKDGSMSNCSPEAINLAVDATNPGQSISHEYGHWLSFHDADVFRATDSFLKSRAGPKIKLKGYKGAPDTDAYSDKFASPAVGQIYAHGANEVLSIGMQMMYAEPRAFLRMDPDHFYLTLGLMTSGGPNLKSEIEDLEDDYLPIEILEIKEDVRSN